MQRRKGKKGENEIASLLRDLTGLDIKRRVRQSQGDSDLEGIPGWVVETKRAKAAQPADTAAWWRQAVAQAVAAGHGLQPVLFSRIDRGAWKARWPVSALLAPECPGWWGWEWSVESTVQGFVATFLETAPFGAGGALDHDPLPGLRLRPENAAGGRLDAFLSVSRPRFTPAAALCGLPALHPGLDRPVRVAPFVRPELVALPPSGDLPALPAPAETVADPARPGAGRAMTDTERIDWLERRQRGVYPVIAVERRPVTSGFGRFEEILTLQGWAVSGTDEVFASIREAVDAAIENSSCRSSSAGRHNQLSC